MWSLKGFDVKFEIQTHFQSSFSVMVSDVLSVFPKTSRAGLQVVIRYWRVV